MEEPSAIVAAAPSLTMSRAGTVTVAVLVGMIAGLAEAANGTIRHRLSHLPTGEVVAGELFWYAPLAAATFMMILAVILLIADGLIGRRIRLVIPGICTGVATYSLLRAMSIGIGNGAAIILSIGVASVVTRFVFARPGMGVAVARRTLPLLAGALVLWAIALPQVRGFRERQALAALPSPATGLPNVLVIIWDTVRALSTSLHGYERLTTPELARLAAEGAVFERAFATSSWSLPSHSSIFTGQYPPEMTVGFRAPLDASHATIGEVLSARGYASAGITANLFYGSRDYGIARGFTWYDERPAFKPLVVAHTWWLSRRVVRAIREARGDYRQILRRDAEHVNAALLQWIARRGDRPFFAVVNHFDAHEPYRPPDPFHAAFAPLPRQYWASDDKKEMTPPVLKELRDSYDGSIRYMDAELGRLRRTLDSLGLLDNTVIIVTADHGEEFGEHRSDLWGHAKTLYRQSVHVPLVLYHPRAVKAGTRIREPVSIRDIPATIVDLVDPGNTSPFPGRALNRLLGRQPEADDPNTAVLMVGEKHRFAAANPHWPTAAGDMFALVSGKYHYILNAGGREELYDLDADVLEHADLADHAEFSPLLEGFRATLDSLVPARGGVRSARIRR